MKVTVVIPSYNHGLYVAQAIHSVMEQSMDNVELIVIDDGSTDASRDVIAALHTDYNGAFRYLARENRGLVATLQEGLDLASGEYFCELASDDYLHPENLARRTAGLDANPEAVMVFTDGLNVDKDGNVIGPITKERIKAVYRSANPIPQILNNNTPVFATGLVRTDALRRCGGFDADTFRYYEDIDTPIRLCRLGRFDYIDEKLFFHRLHATNVSRVTNHIRREKILFYRKMLRQPEMQAYRTLLLKRMRRSGIALARTLLKGSGINEADCRILTETVDRFPLDLRLRWYSRRVRQKNSQCVPGLEAG
ncbi:glycosyltransferase [Gilvimarinus sp. F26214L]|uniref:glycosyltransferase n=1 Tax=Gilvimarinus sp. DZF01 TaxID=3461371 RepID=UPI0040465CAD